MYSLLLVFALSRTLLCVMARSVLKGYTIQHLPDGTVMVESIVIKVSSSAEDPNTKVLLLSWSYQVKRLVVLNCSLREIGCSGTFHCSTPQSTNADLKTAFRDANISIDTITSARKPAQCEAPVCSLFCCTSNSSLEAGAENDLKQVVFHFDIHNLSPDETNQKM